MSESGELSRMYEYGEPLLPVMCMTLNIGGGRSSGYGLLRILQCLSITSISNLNLLHSYLDFRKHQRFHIIKAEKDIFGKWVPLVEQLGYEFVKSMKKGICE